MIEDWQNGGFGIYVHWPFCEAKCPYCDFNSHVVRQIDHDRWSAAYLTELDRAAELTQGRVVQSVFFGGGTPSLMKPQTVAAIVDRIAKRWPLSNNIEITLEANPSSVEADKFAAFHSAGVNRVSLGIQALNDVDLKKLGRLHNTHEALRALEIAQSCFDRASFDLICARQDQTLASWEAELKQALTLGFLHMSLYQLTIEDGTAFGDRYKAGRLSGLPDDDEAADMYESTQQLCKSAGLPQYEISNFAAPGQESQHNLVYWRYGDYVGIGPGAHGRITLQGAKKHATEAVMNPQSWLNAVDTKTGATTYTLLTRFEQAQEFLLMNLRLREGLSLERYAALSGVPINPVRMTDLKNNNMLIENNGHISVAENYVSVTNYVISELAPD